MRSIRNRRRGGNAIEFALTLPVFIAISFAMIEFGWYFSRVALLNSAVMDGCREGALIDEDLGNAGTEATTRMNTVLASGGLSCTTCGAVIAGAVPNKVLQCNAEIDYDGLTGWFMALGVMPGTINTQTQVRLEWQRN